MANLYERLIIQGIAQRSGAMVDTLYASVVHKLGLHDRFFREGFGNLDVIDFHKDMELFSSWPPPHLNLKELPWKWLHNGTYNKAAYSVYECEFRTPCMGKVYDALPVESRTAHALWIAPKQPAEGGPTSLHLAATGDFGYGRRQMLGTPLVKQGIGTMALESPFYGRRKPPYQRRSKLHYVSDLLLLGRATIEESLLLLQALTQQGHSKLGIAGLSMGGVHATMVASLFPGPLALTPLLAPRSAAGAYCSGALYHATAWDELLDELNMKAGDILRAVDLASAANERVTAARRQHTVAALRENAAERDLATQLAAGEAAAAALAGVAAAAAESSSNGSAAGCLSLEQGVGRSIVGSAAPSTDAGNSFVGSVQSWIERLRGKGLGGWRWRPEGRLLEGQQRDHSAAVALLQEVLETYTDVTRFPRPQRPDAAVIVGASQDAYVSPQSVLDLHAHLPGSEVRWVPGGHVSSFILHQPAFRQAVADSLSRL